MSIAYSAHMSVALLIQDATRMPHILKSSVASLVVHGFLLHIIS